MKKATLTRLIVGVLVGSTLAMALASCTEGGKGSTNTGTPTTQDPSDTTISADLPDKDWEGTTFNVLHWYVTSWPSRMSKDLVAEEVTGDPVNDAVYKRNAALAAKYNFNIALENSEDVESLVQKAITTSDQYYDLVYGRLRSARSLALKGYYYDFETAFQYVDLDKPYWDQDVRESLSFANKVYLMASSINIEDEDATAALLFNKTIAQDCNINVSDLYASASAGTWTMDSLLELMKIGKKDLNGDQVIDDKNDQYGFLGGRDVMMSFFFGGGGRFTEKDSEDLPVYIFEKESNYDIVFKICDIMQDEAFMNHHTISNNDDTYYRSIFSDGRGLFFWCRMDDVASLRGVEAFDFGILPIPKYQESQETYLSLVSQHTMGLMSVMNVVADTDRVGFIMEALASASYYDLTSAYYEKSLKGRGTRDDESEEMLDLIFARRTFDIGEIYGFGDFDEVFLCFGDTKNNNISSLYEKYETKIESDIKDFRKEIEELENMSA